MELSEVTGIAGWRHSLVISTVDANDEA